MKGPAMLQGDGEAEIRTQELAAEIVAAFVAHNSLPVGELPGLIASVDAALRGLAGRAPAASPTEKPTPAVSIRKSVTPDYLICLDDGKQFKSLNRHLATLGMTPDDYRAKWGLPADYPMVAPNYAATRSKLAKSMRLGQTRKTAPAKRGRTSKASA
jgi:predicted transcriptional regulator